MKVLRLSDIAGQNNKMLLSSEYIASEDAAQTLRPKIILPQKGTPIVEMDYNQLKIRVLGLFAGTTELASEEVRKLLQSFQIEVSDKAMKMALMRYTRQGLLARSKRQGHYHYSLTEKGAARRDWLSKPR